MQSIIVYLDIDGKQYALAVGPNEGEDHLLDINRISKTLGDALTETILLHHKGLLEQIH